MSNEVGTQAGGQQAVNRPRLVSRTGILQRITRSILDSLTRDDLFDTETVQSMIINDCNNAIDAQNMILAKGQKLSMVKQLEPVQVADIMIRKYRIVLVNTSHNAFDTTQSILAIYMEDGDMEGIYVESESMLNRYIQDTVYDFPPNQYRHVRDLLRNMALVVEPCRDPDLIAVNNGIFNYRTKTLEPFDPEKVFLSKSSVDYNPNVSNTVIHNPDDGTDWNVEDWMKELSDDPDVVHLLWQILGAIIRPNVSWNKSAWFYSESGNNGKGTLCELMRQLCGDNAYVSLALSDMGIDFKLEPLLHASAIIVDENDVGTFIDKAANLKAIITGDMLQINRKFRVPVTYAFHGFMVQCLNEMPKIKDKSDSFFRRQIFVPFTKCFTGMERKYIKDDYLHRKDVLEYVLYKVLNMDYYNLDVPASCDKALDEYKQYVDPVYLFLTEMMDRFTWDLLPWTFLYDLYAAWYKRNNQGGFGGIISRVTFTKDVKIKIEKYYGDTWKISDAVVRPGGKMSVPEPLIAEYDLQSWMNPMYMNSKDTDKKCIPVLLNAYRGAVRR